MIGNAREFTVALSQHQQDFGQKADLIVKGVVQTLFNEIQSGGRYSPGTPVDTGNARAHWFGGIGGEGNLDASGTAAAAKAGDLVVISNNVPYIGALEDGHSKQAPTGMVKLAILNAEHIVREVATQVLSTNGT